MSNIPDLFYHKNQKGDDLPTSRQWQLRKKENTWINQLEGGGAPRREGKLHTPISLLMIAWQKAIFLKVKENLNQAWVHNKALEAGWMGRLSGDWSSCSSRAILSNQGFICMRLRPLAHPKVRGPEPKRQPPLCVCIAFVNNKQLS